MDEELAVELARMAAEDQRIRRPPKGSARTMVRRLDPKTAADLARIDAEKADRLRQILSDHGWPGKSLVGEQGAHDAWLIAQHALGCRQRTAGRSSTSRSVRLRSSVRLWSRSYQTSATVRENTTASARLSA